MPNSELMQNQGLYFGNNPNLTEKEFGFVAKTDFEEGLRKTIEWYERNIINKNIQ